MTVKLIADVSNYTGILQRKTVDELLRLNVEHLIAGTQVPSVTNQQVHAWLDSKPSQNPDIYVIPANNSADGYWDMLAGLTKYAVEDIPYFFKTSTEGRVWLDLEAEPPQGKYTHIAGSDGILWIEQGLKALRKVGFKRFGIYTSKLWWETHTNNVSTHYTTLPLWYSHPDNSLSMTAKEWRRDGFGGWWKPKYKQYTFNTYVNDQVVDLNVGPT